MSSTEPVMIHAPDELAARPQWVMWRYEERREPKPTKVPYNAHTGERASSTDATTWSTVDETLAGVTRYGMDGIGYVLSPDDPYAGVDLDRCRDPQSGRIEGWAKAIMRRLDSYTEISPSGTGLRIFVRGSLPPHGRRKGKIEVYCQARFLTITGERVLGLPATIQDRSEQLLAWHHDVFGDPPERKQNGHVERAPVQLADADLLLKARDADNGAKFWALWNGDYSSYGSQSEADLALSSELAFWTGPDEARIDQLFRSSGLMREKWDRDDYRARTIAKALEGRTEFYGDQKPSPRLQPTVIDPETGEVLVEPSWRSLHELVQAAPDPGRQLVEGLLWELRTHWVYSGPGAGKTLTWLAILMHVAAGRPFHGHEVVQGTVLLIEEDSPDNVISEYVQMLADIYDINLENLPFYINKFRGIRLTDKAGLDSVRNMIVSAPSKPLVLMLDACERIVPSEQFNSRELDPLSQLFTYCQTNQITPVIIDHTRKAGTKKDENHDPIEMLYGGRSKSAISDVMMFFSGAIKSQATITFTKFRGTPPSMINVKFDGAAGFTLDSGKAQLSEIERQVMMLINNARGGLTRDEIEEHIGVSKNTMLRALRRLVEIGYVERSGENRDTLYSASRGGGSLFALPE